MAASPTIRVAPNPDIRLEHIDDGRPYAIVDDFLADPDGVIANLAQYAGDFFVQPMAHPGRAPDIGADAMQEIFRFVRSTLSKHFPYHRTGMSLRAFFSNVALQPEELTAYHRMCHIDPRLSPQHRTYAGVIYLFSNPDLGGTGFYRWRNKEVAIRAYQLGAQDNEAALEYLREHSEVYRKPPEYMTSSNDIAELVGVVPASFNRMVFYDGELPHSGHITNPELLSNDPLKGRLTLNFFANVIPRAG